MIAAIVFLSISIGLLYLGNTVSFFAEWYTNHIYQMLSKAIGSIAGIFLFSIAEIGLYVGILIFIITGLSAIIHKKKVRWLCSVFLGLAILLFLFVINCGINYHGKSFAGMNHMQVNGYTAGELKTVCQWLTNEVNESSERVERNSDGLMVLSEGEEQRARIVMEKLGESYSALDGQYPNPKKIMISEILSWQGITGIYSPFTIEANYNQDMTDYNIPFTMCHELSHLRGFMQEEEANYIAFLACISSHDAEFEYSGYLMAWIYAMNELYHLDKNSWKNIREMLQSEVLIDLEGNSSFWNQYEGKAEEISQTINDTYLKANGQQDGVKSYDRMVDLVVWYYKMTEE